MNSITKKTLRELELARGKNNSLWMEIISVCFDLAEEKTKGIFKEINKNDKIISDLKASNGSLDGMSGARKNNNKLWLGLVEISRGLDPKKVKSISDRIAVNDKKISKIVEELTK